VMAAVISGACDPPAVTHGHDDEARHWAGAATD
jgi:hypothetical protein